MKITGAGWLAGPPKLPGCFLAPRCPQILLDQFEIAKPPVEHRQADEIGWTEEMNEAAIREQRRRAEGFASLDDAAAAWEFSRRIPDESLRLAAAYPENNFSVLEALCHVEGVVNRIRENPALALGLIRADEFGAVDYADRLAMLRKAVRLKQRSALRSLGFPADAKTARILCKIEAGAVTIANLRWLRARLAEDEFSKTLAHRPSIGVQDLAFLYQADGILSPRLMRELLADLVDRRRDLAADLIVDSKRMSAELDEAWPPRGCRFEGLRSLKRFHDALAARARAKADADYLRRPFPPPPLPASGGIEPISSGDQLLQEAEEMQHCVVSYVRSILAGDYYVYRVTGEGRATLGLFKDRAGSGNHQSRWRLGQLYGRANSEVSLATEVKVRSWLDVTHSQ